MLEIPAGHAGRRTAVVCHPHPLYGGTMTNKVVHTVARALQEQGYATLRFNFRGVGQSHGSYDEGRGERDDGLAACAWLGERFPGATLSLAGFSFGGYVAARIALALPVRELVLIAPAVGRFEFTARDWPDAPCLIVQGDSDEVIEASAVLGFAATVTPPPTLAVLNGASHFFHGRLSELKALVGDYLKSRAG